MKAKSIQATTSDNIKIQLENCIADGFKPTLAFVFLSALDELKNLMILLDAENIAIFGATTSGEFTEKGIETNSIAILLLDINPGYFKIVLSDNKNSSPEESAQFAGEIGKNAFSNPAFIVSVSYFKTPGESIIKGLINSVGKDVTIIGGFSGDLETYEGNVFTNNQSSNYGLLTLILDQDKIDVKGEAVSGWKPMGTTKMVTKTDGGWILAIDNQPAMEMVKKYIGSENIEENSSENIVNLNTTYPLQVDRDGDSPILIPPLQFNTENSSVLCGQPIKEGTTFRFSLPPDFDVIDTVIESSRKMKEREMPEADALVVFSCVVRLMSLGPMIEEEIKGLTSIWGKPAAGFFCMGEFGRVAGGKPEFHGTTCSWVALKEK